MIRKISIIVPAILVGLFAAGGMASAAAPYPQPAPVSVTVNVTGDVNGTINIIVGNTITFSGDGFDSSEGIGVDVFYSGPNGLRSNEALARLSASAHSETAADANGHFDNDVVLDQVGTATLLATGHGSGKTASLTVNVLEVGSTTTPGASTAVGGGGSNAAAGSDGSGLARTGASIAGPLAIGFVALFAGLTLLFLGTRGVRQRKNARSWGAGRGNAPASNGPAAEATRCLKEKH